MKQICVTNRKLVRGDFLAWLENVLIAPERPDAVVLREKDLGEDEYRILARGVREICLAHDTELIVNTYYAAAEELGIRAVHLPYGLFSEVMAEQGFRQRFARIGTSVHSPQEAKQAERLGADYVFAGHVFATDCKRGLAPRGLDFLRACCLGVQIPVYAIGGIPLERAAEASGTAERKERSRKQLCARCGAAGVCIMSDYARLGQ